MSKLRTILIISALVIPLSASAFSFGGRIVSIIPCLSAVGPALHITIVPAGLFPIAYIWTPVTFTRLAGPPTHPGQQVLGLYDIPFVCTIGVPPATIPLPGLRVLLGGTSAI